MFDLSFSYARIEIFKQCTTISGTIITEIDGQQSEEKASITRCELIFVDVGNDGGGGSGDIDNGGSSGEPGGEPGDGGADNINPFDIDGDGLMDCWHNLTGSKRITEAFGVHRDPTTNKCGFHNGLDIGTAQEGGEIPLYSGTQGKISAMGYNSKAGYYILVANENGSYTFYCHLRGTNNKPETQLSIGDTVTIGEQIGITNHSGNSNGDHLHISFYFSGEKSLEFVQNSFPSQNLSNQDVRYCPDKNKTYINPEKILGNCN